MIKLRSSSIIELFCTSSSWFQLSIHADLYLNLRCWTFILQSQYSLLEFLVLENSVIIQNCFTGMKEPKGVQTIVINFSTQTTALSTQQAIEDKLEKKIRSILGAAIGKSIAVFVDDLNMPEVEQYSAQFHIELLRLFIDRIRLYDRTELFWKDVEDTKIIWCTAPPGEGRNPTTPRFVRHFNVFWLPTSNKLVLQTIFSSILDGFLNNGFMDTVQKLQEACVDTTI